jgi:hypothetical protein
MQFIICYFSGILLDYVDLLDSVIMEYNVPKKFFTKNNLSTCQFR